MWTKLSDDFGDQCADLSDAAFRTHTEGLLWTMRRVSGGVITRREVNRLAETEDPDAAVQELLKQGFWSEENEGYRIEHHMKLQLEKEVIERRREKDAERQRRHRRKKLGMAGNAAKKSRRDSRDD